jgi:quercetin dioxygenase-like cupin family protein
MYFNYKESKGIKVPQPFARVMTPLFMRDTSACDADFSIHVTEWEPGCRVDAHRHSSGTEAMYCMAGSGKAYVEGKEYDFIPDSLIIAAPGEEHQIENTGEVTLRVLCIFSPPVTEKELEERALQAVIK